MSPKKPPLEAVRVVRAALADAAQERLVAAVSAEARAEHAAAQAAEAERRARVEAAAAEARERESLASPRDFAQHAAFGLGLERRMAELAAVSTTTEAAAREAERHATEARGALGAARADLELVERHQAEARRLAAATAEAHAEEQAAEAHAGRRGRP